MAGTSDWALAIDFGTSYTAAAVAREGRVEVLEIDGSPRMPSLVLVGEEGELIVGRAAEQQAPLFPGRVERAPKRYLGVPRPLLIDGAPVRAVEVVGRILDVVMTEARRRRGGTEPSEVVLTHPARWADSRLEALLEAASLAGIQAPSLVPEPVAAARYFAEGQIEIGQNVAVYDLGGGTFDTAVLRRTADGYELAGPPGGQEDLGGEAFDDRIFRYFGGHLDPDAWEQIQKSDDRRWRQARAAMRNQSREAKEALSRDQAYTAAIPLPVDAQVRITRGELEDLIRFDLKKTVAELADTIRGAGLANDEVAAIYLVGGSSRVPVVTRLLSETFGRMPVTWDDPKAVVSLGAAKSTAPAQGRDAGPVPLAAVSLAGAGALAAANGADAAALPDVEPVAADATAAATPDAVADDAAGAGAMAPPEVPVDDAVPAGMAAAAATDSAAGAPPPKSTAAAGFMLGPLGPATPRRRRVAAVAPLVGLAAALVFGLVAFGAAGFFGSSPGPSTAVATPSSSARVAVVSPSPTRSPSQTPSASPLPTAAPSTASLVPVTPAPLTVTPAPAAPRSATPRPATPRPATPRPATPRPATPRPATPPPPPPPPPPVNHAPVRASGCATENVTASGVYEYYNVWILASCFSDSDGDSLEYLANQPSYGVVAGTAWSNCAPGDEPCWRYTPPGSWDGSAYSVSITIFARDPDGAKSSNANLVICVAC